MVELVDGVVSWIERLLLVVLKLTFIADPGVGRDSICVGAAIGVDMATADV